MRTVALYSIKGGVGKTSAAVNLAAGAAERGWRVLLWDLDPQGAATYLLRVKPKVKGGGRSLASRKRALAEMTRATDIPNLDLVPADFRYRHLDLVLDQTKRPTRRLEQVIRGATEDYDFVVLDCAPSASLVSEGVLVAADLLLVPVVPATLAARTVDQVVDLVAAVPESRRPDVMAFLSMVDRRKRLHRELAASLPGSASSPFAPVAIPNAAVVERMGAERRPLHRFAPSAPAAAAYSDLWGHVERHLASS